MESTFWRPFWQNIKTNKPLWHKLKNRLIDIEDKLIGEMTGADRSINKFIRRFEDLNL